MKSDIQISRETKLKPIQEIANAIGIPSDKINPYGHHKAKVPYDLIGKPKGKLILVTAITPTKAGIGKTTTSVGLALGLEKIGKKSVVALREPSLGPCFGMKGGAAGGGYAQVLPMEDINLHFTGDFHAITAAHNMISALLDNYQHQNRSTGKKLKQILWKRVLDVNDRTLRRIVTGMGAGNGEMAESSFDITAASEIMAILCLSENLEDLRTRIDNVLLGYTFDNQAFRVKDLGIGGAATVLLKDALHPNLVQTTEHTAAFIHGGPFANIAHGCNSVVATKMALTFGDYIITEAGFGADLGAEKFFNIKCRKAKLNPDATVVVVTSQALKLHGNVPDTEISTPNLDGLKAGLPNLERHLDNLKGFGQSVIVAFNQYEFDTEEEMNFLKEWCTQKGVCFAINNSFAQGGEGSKVLAEIVVETIANKPSDKVQFSYQDDEPIADKIANVVKKIYRGNGVSFSKKAQIMLRKIQKQGFNHLPVCIAKTQYSFSDDAKKLGAATDFNITIQDLILNTGAGFVVAVAGNIMRMPGLPKVPQANFIDIVDGDIEGLS